MDIQNLKQTFDSYFNSESEIIVRAPGRVNLIGEHTDYNEGFVLPMAIDRAVWLALRSRADGQVHIQSLDIKSGAQDDPKPDAAFELHSLTKSGGWIEYPKGVAYQLMKAGYELRGFDAVMTGDVPRGAGLSSSAAVELAVARAFAAVSGFDWDALKMAKIAQKAENKWVGVNCGIMDQIASAASKEGHALFLDCRSLEIQHVPLPKGISIVILDTSTRRGLVDSVYNERRRQCEEVAHWFGVKALRDVNLEEFERKLALPKEHRDNVSSVEGMKEESGLADVAMKRARHVVTENDRVLEAVDAMKTGNVKRLGELFDASHDSLRDDFEVSNEALNTMVDCAREQKSCYGARMTGAGFGGCAVALVDQEKAREFESAVARVYRQRSGLEASVHVCQAGEGASIVMK